MSYIRITSGIYKGRKIATPGAGTHPMGERERLALFNMIFDDLSGARVLDTYAGSGALGIEALSRGVREVEFIEKNARATKVIRENLRSLGLEAEIFTGDVVNFTTDTGYDVILVDPPYDDFNLTGVEHLMSFVKNSGILVLSHPGEAPELEGLTLKKSRSYAGATISIYRKD